ncbi:hypothetical protein MMC17_002074 [Xylographa soralifera]|nr:hypothetical protein [Xylographa soralifera]
MGQETQQSVLSASPSMSTTVSPEETLSPSQEKSLELSAEPKSEAPAIRTANNAGPPPNGGLRAWLQVLGSFMLFFNSWGLLNTFGVFQTYYESGVLFTESSSNIAWIGGLQAYLVLTVSFFSGPIYDRGYLRTLVSVGSFGIVFGLMMLSICETYWQALLAQGFVVGIGAGCLFVPCVAVLPAYFNTRLGLALGVAVAGSSLGGVVYPIVLYRLIDSLGFGWSVRVLAFIALGTLLIPIVVMRMRVKPPKARALIDWSAFTDWEWGVFTVASVIGFIGIPVILFYISYYAEDQRITDTKIAFYVIPIFNAASCFGRVLPNALSDKTGPFNIIVPGSFMFGVCLLCMMAVKTEAGVIVLAILTGFFSGVYIALPPLCFVALTKDKTKIGSRMGMAYSIIAFGMLAGGPGGGNILGKADPLNWHGLWILGGVSCCVSSLMYAGLRMARYGLKLNVKA